MEIGSLSLFFPAFESRVEGLAGNRTAGASELLAEALELLLELARAPAEPSEFPRLLALLQNLQQAQSSMAPLLNLGSEALQLAKVARNGQELALRLKGLVRSWRRREKGAEREIAAVLRALLADAGHLVTYSRSGTALVALRACRRSGLRFRISLSQGSPQMEGVAAAEELAQMGFPVTLTTDAGLFGRLADADAFLCGADAVTRQGIVNKLGTRALAEAARRRRIPVYVACAPDKFLQAQAETLFCIRHGPGSELLSGDRLAGRGGASLQPLNPYFDVTPQRLVTRLISGPC